MLIIKGIMKKTATKTGDVRDRGHMLMIGTDGLWKTSKIVSERGKSPMMVGIHT